MHTSRIWDRYYPAATVPAVYEVAVVAMGSLAVLCFFGACAALASCCQRYLGQFPEGAARFVLGAGVAAIVDPVLMLASDLANGMLTARSSPARVSLSQMLTCRCGALFPQDASIAQGNWRAARRQQTRRQWHQTSPPRRWRRRRVARRRRRSRRRWDRTAHRRPPRVLTRRAAASMATHSSCT